MFEANQEFDLAGDELAYGATALFEQYDDATPDDDACENLYLIPG